MDSGGSCVVFFPFLSGEDAGEPAVIDVQLLYSTVQYNGALLYVCTRVGLGRSVDLATALPAR